MASMSPGSSMLSNTTFMADSMSNVANPLGLPVSIGELADELAVFAVAPARDLIAELKIDFRTSKLSL
jgi:hypothetical protein